MRLTAIRLHGFKSFADATVFPVDAAVTGIIGPNGCGKSNIIDAVRWVLGESAAKQLRGASLTDVIFAGSSGRKAAAMASVELHFDNADGSAGGAFASYAEIIVRRSVESDGTSQYFINRQRCRRRDIVELLQGTGVGARSYAVIEQGMVSRIVESKPEELRTFVEEAAGVALYRSRRRDSERRMEQVRELLDRHEDRLQQLAKSRERLEKEAITAVRYRELHSELAGHEYRLQSWLLFSACRERDAANAQYAQDEQALADLMLDVQRLHAAAEGARAALREAEAAHAPLQARCEAAQAAVQRESVRKAGLQSTLDYAQRALDSARQRHDKLQQQQDQDDGEAQAHQDALQLLEKTVAEMRLQEGRAREEYQQAQQDAQQARGELDRAST
ncbi:MAG: AAA family ATPase, partial [Cardiobacteriaceae bacterium]|nr:AAA family ATPase [Cardiobacteriaceae bacterium]